MKKCLIKGMTVIMISTMLASTPVVSYAAETEPKNLTESAVPESDVQNAVNMNVRSVSELAYSAG